MDDIERCQTRKPRDKVTTKLRAIHRRNGLRVDLSRTLHAWREARPDLSCDLDDLTAELPYRHRLAHGRYWVPKLGRRYDGSTVYRICEAATAPRL